MARESFADYRHDRSAHRRGVAVLPQKQSLPSSEQQPPFGERHRLARARQRHLDMARHVIRALLSVLKVRIPLRNQPTQPSLEVTPRRRIGVLHDHETRARMLAKHRHHPAGQSATLQHARHRCGDLMQPAPARAQFQRLLKHNHASAKPPHPSRTSLWTRFSLSGRAAILLRAHKKDRAD